MVRIVGQRPGLLNGLSEPVPCILNALLDLSLLPTRSRVAERCLEQIVTHHREEADLDAARHTMKQGGLKL